MTSPHGHPVAGSMARIAPAYAPSRTRVGDIADDHHQLRREAAALLVLAEHGGPLDRARSEVFVERLSHLAQHLREHFALEEAGGYLVEVVLQRPGLQTRVDSLQRQHATLLAEAESLTRDLLGAQPAHDALSRLVRLLEALRRHENGEHDLFQQAFSDDLGSGD
ncbi:MAG: hemerythrin domain-containing protein [Candidatus Binatia bacterium]